MDISILFFGSTADSLLVLKKLNEHKWNVVGVVTQPPRPVGRKQIITPTPTEIWALEKHIPVYSFKSSQQSFRYEHEDEVIKKLESIHTDLLISASYGQKIPTTIISHTRFGGLNVHPSLLPRWRGADPIPWEILSGDRETGTSIVTLTEHMDEGKVMAQTTIPLQTGDTHEKLREKLFQLGSQILVDILPDFLDGTLIGTLQNPANAIIAKRLTRDDGYISWDLVQKAVQGEVAQKEEFPLFLQQFLLHSDHTQLAPFICRAINALSPWPGIWTIVQLNNGEKKRLKILAAHETIRDTTSSLMIDKVQLEGKNPGSMPSSMIF